LIFGLNACHGGRQQTSGMPATEAAAVDTCAMTLGGATGNLSPPQRDSVIGRGSHVLKFSMFSDSTIKNPCGISFGAAGNMDSIYIVRRPVTIVASTVQSTGSDDYTFFRRPFELAASTIEAPSHDPAMRSNIQHCIFDSSMLVDGNIYDARLRLANCIFKASATFVNPCAKPPVSSGYIAYQNPVFANCIFYQGVSFTARSQRNSGLLGSCFKNDLYFYQCGIHGTLDLAGCHFDSNSRLNLIGSNLPDTIDLSYAKFTQTIDLTGSRLNDVNKPCQINLLGCDIDKIKLWYGNFHLYIPDSISNDASSRDLVSGTYEALLNNLQKNGYKESYRKLSIEYKDWQAKSDRLLWVSGWWWGYGYRKWQVLLWTIGFLLGFSLINVFIYRNMYATYEIKELKATDYVYSKFPVFEWIQRYWLSIIYTGFIFFKLSINTDNIKIKKWSLLLLLFVEYLIGLLCAAYLINWVVTK
jgi:hypothetical protein